MADAPEERHPEFSVYGGQDCLGYVVEQRHGKWTAFTAGDQRIGTFPNRRAATDAICGCKMMRPPENVVRFDTRAIGEPRFGRVSPAAARVRIRAESHRVYVTLACFANRDGWCWPSVSLIAARSAISRRHVHRAIQQLVAVGLVRIERSIAGKNRYQLIGVSAPIATDGDAPIATDGDAPITTGGDAPIATGGDAPIATGGDAPIATGGTRAKKNIPRNRIIYFKPRDDDCDLARWRGYDAIWINDQVERFRDHCLSNGRAFHDVDAAWRNWMRKAMDLDDDPPDPPSPEMKADPAAAEDSPIPGGSIEACRKIVEQYKADGALSWAWPRVHGLPPQHRATRVPQKIREEFGFT
jgi:hypothetical protein